MYTSGTSSENVGYEAPSLQPNEAVRLDLEHQLECNLKKIEDQYADYVTCICESLETKCITTKKLSSYLLRLPALKLPVDTDNQQHKLLDGLRTELRKAETIDEIVDRHSSFLDCGIFQKIVKHYSINKNQTDENNEILKYPEHLKDYIEKHKLSEFMKINPELSKLTNDSEELTLKFEIDLLEYRLANLVQLKRTIAKILEVQPSTLRLLHIEEGCVVITFLVPSSVAHFIFPSGKVLTAQQMKRFRDLSALWLKCCGCYVDFTHTVTDQR